MTQLFVSVCIGFFRSQIRVSRVIVHENFTDSVNDIALLKLGKNNQPLSTSIQFNLQRSGWISQSSALPVFLNLVKTLLVRKGMSMVS